MIRMDLSTNQIHLWFADHADFEVDELQASCDEWLTKAELVRCNRFQIEKRRKEYLLGKMLVRTVLSEYGTLSPGQWQFTENQYGRPSVPAGLVTPDIHFNLSHSGERLVLAVSRMPEIGVDIEASSRMRRVERIADRYFSEAEIDALLQLDKEGQLMRFHELWTLKESYIKARGMGLALPLQKFGFEIVREGAIAFYAARELDAEPGRWRFWQLEPGGDYKLALALKPGADSGVIQIDSFQRSTLSGMRALESRILRQS